jgi:hypothetical protein
MQDPERIALPKRVSLIQNGGRQRNEAFVEPFVGCFLCRAALTVRAGRGHCRHQINDFRPSVAALGKARSSDRPGKSDNDPCAEGARGGDYSGRTTPDPPNSAGKSLSLGSPSFIGSTVSE